MALTLEGINKVKQRCRRDTRTPGVTENLRAFFKHMEAKGNPDLQFVAFDETGQVGAVIADVPCKVYVVYFKKPVASTVAAWLKLIDATTVGTEAKGDMSFKQAAAVGAPKEHCAVFGDGFYFATGVTIATDKAADNSTASEVADSAAGFVIVGAP